MTPFLAAALVLQSLGVAPPSADATEPVAERWRWRTMEALSGEELRSVVGYPGGVYVATRSGVYRYDGLDWERWTQAELGGGAVTALHRGQDGRTWLGTDTGILLRDGDGWRTVFPDTAGADFPVRSLTSLADGSLLAGSPWGLVRLDAAGATLHVSPDVEAAARASFPGVEVIAVSNRVTPSVPWGAGSGLRVVAASDPRVGMRHAPVVVATVAPGGPADAAGIRPGDVLAPPEGFERPWGPGVVEALAADSGVVTVRRRGGPASMVALARAPVPGSAEVFDVVDVLTASDGAVWLGLSTGDLLRIPGGASGLRAVDTWRVFGEGDGRSLGQGPRLAEGRDGAIWAVSASAFGGVNRFDGRGWTTWRLSAEGGSDINPSVTVDPSGDVWVGGLGGLHRFRDGRWAVFHRPSVPLPGTRVFVESAANRLWIGGAGAGAHTVDVSSERWMSLPGVLYQGRRTTSEGLERWFVSDDGTVRVRRGEVTRDFDVLDGLIESVTGLLVDDEGVWAAGSHAGVAATARWTGGGWERHLHPDLSWSVDHRALFRARDGSVWAGGAADPVAAEGQLGGVARWADGTWTYDTPPEAPGAVYGFGADDEGRIWAGGPEGVFVREGGAWSWSGGPWDSLTTRVDAVASAGGAVWLGTRASGVYRIAEGRVDHVGTGAGLPSNAVLDIAAISADEAWILTSAGARRLGPEGITPTVLDAAPPPGPFASLSRDDDGTLWLGILESDPSAAMRLNRFRQPFGAWTLRVSPETAPPETTLDPVPGRLPRAAVVSFSWIGRDPWEATPAQALTYSHRLDDGPWSAFGDATTVRPERLESGDHTFEVRARDQDGNVDPTPARATFTVAAPVWAQAWFQMLVGGLLVVVALQARAVRLRGVRLAEANASLERRVRERTSELRRTYDELRQEVTGREAAEHRLRQAQKMEAVGRLAAGISHDFNNLLTVILGTTELQLAEEENQDRREDLQDIHDAASRAAELTQQLLAFSRRQVLSPEVLDVNLVVGGMEKMLRRLVSEDVDLRFRPGEGLPPVVADRSGLEQVILNLVVNSWEALAGPGSVEVRTGVADLDADGAATVDAELPHGRYVLLTVADDGPGMAPEVVDDVFEPFFTTKESGTGLGLATVFGVVKQSGGAITAESARGSGATFTVYLPADGGAPAGGDQAPPASDDDDLPGSDGGT